jgi:hypothetical protein
MQMRNGVTRRGLFGATLLMLLLATPHTSFAQTVPVLDAKLNSSFTAYASQFDKFASKNDSQMEDLKEMIAGDGESGKGCTYNPVPNEAEAYTVAGGFTFDGAWKAASDQTGSNIPTKIPVDEHTGDSVRCLLMEIAEWEKLGLSIQIHSMLKTYISDAQARQLNNQLGGKISAAKLRWASQGNQVISKSGNSKSPVYETNAVQSINNEKSRRLQHLTAQATGDPDVADFGVCSSWKFDVAANATRNNIAATEDPIQTGPSRMACGDPSDGADFGSFSGSFNSPGVGGMSNFMKLLNDPTASPLGATSLMNAEAANALAQQEAATRFRKSTTGADADVECSGAAGDPFCLSNLGTSVTPAFQNERAVADAAASGDEMVMNADNLDGGAGRTAEEQSTAINTGAGGLLGYDETGLLNQETAVNDLVREFYDVIGTGYYAVNAESQDWAQATMLMIYDEMKFDPGQPTVVVTTNNDDPDPIEYY